MHPQNLTIGFIKQSYIFKNIHHSLRIFSVNPFWTYLLIFKRAI